MAECIVQCQDHPDSVDKINWKCVECDTDLKGLCESTRKDKQDVATAKAVEAAKPKPGELTEEQIKHRQDMAKE